MNANSVQRLTCILSPSHERVLIRPFIPDDENRRYRIIGRVMTLSEEKVHESLHNVLTEFADRHHDIRKDQ